MRESLYSRVKAIRALNTTTIATNTATNGIAVGLDQTGADFRVATLVVLAGTITDGTYAVKVQESADGSTSWTDVPSDRVQGGGSVTLSHAVLETGVIPDPSNKPFLRGVITSTATTTGGSLSAIFLLGSPSSAPVVRP